MRTILVGARQAVTPCGEGVRVLPSAAVSILNGRIEAIGAWESLRSLGAMRVEEVDGVILPGFVDAHTHPVYGGDRLDEFSARSAGATYREISAGGGGILSTVRQTRAATCEEIFDVGARNLQRFIENGTTTLEAKTGYGLDPATELRLLRSLLRLGEELPVRVLSTYLGAHAVPPEFQSNPDGYVEEVCRTMEIVAREGLARWCDGFFEEGYFGASHIRRLAARSRELGLGWRMHADQFSDAGGASLAAEVGAITADHLEHTGADGIRALAAAGITPVLLPASVYCLGLSKYPDARAMLDAGLQVVLATDFNPGSSPTYSMPFVLSLACTQMRMTPEEALVAGTLNPARTLGLQDEAGSLDPSKSADLSLWPCKDWREVIYHPASLRPTRVYCRGLHATRTG